MFAEKYGNLLLGINYKFNTAGLKLGVSSRDLVWEASIEMLCKISLDRYVLNHQVGCSTAYQLCWQGTDYVCFHLGHSPSYSKWPEFKFLILHDCTDSYYVSDTPSQVIIGHRVSAIVVFFKHLP